MSGSRCLDVSIVNDPRQMLQITMKQRYSHPCRRRKTSRSAPFQALTAVFRPNGSQRALESLPSQSLEPAGGDVNGVDGARGSALSPHASVIVGARSPRFRLDGRKQTECRDECP
jgi:hypothetical protein